MATRAPGSMHGLIARFGEADDLLAAVRKAREAGYKKMDAYTPFAVEGLVEELGHVDDRVPKIVFVFGMLGALAGFGFQCYVVNVDYPINIGGRPGFSWPSFMPITFETGVVFAAFAAVIGMLALSGLPRLHHPVWSVKGIERATDDKFFLCIEARDPQFEPKKTREFLEGLGSEEVKEVPVE